MKDIKGFFRTEVFSPFHPVVVALSVGLTIIAVVLFSRLRETDFELYARLYCDAGPVGYLILMAMFMNLLSLLLMHKRFADTSYGYFIALTAAAMLPSVLGGIASLQQVGEILSHAANMLEVGAIPPPDPKALLEAIPSSLDKAFVGLVTTVSLLFIAGSGAMKKAEKESNNQLQSTANAEASAATEL